MNLYLVKGKARGSLGVNYKVYVLAATLLLAHEAALQNFKEDDETAEVCSIEEITDEVVIVQTGD